jgi:AraC-like DNA-binding protein
MLSKRIGTNPCKLKQLFRQHFETTPYGMLLDIRMQQAAQLLKNRQTPINKIAESVGYQHPSNFSTAFSRYFGYSPKSLKHKK